MIKLKIYNMALSYIGNSYFIESTENDDGSPSKRLCDLFWESAVSAVTEMYEWPFLTLMDDIRPARAEYIPNYFCYKMHPHVFKVLGVSSVAYPKIMGADFEVMGKLEAEGNVRYIVSRKELMLVKYQTYAGSEEQFPQSFRDAVALKLASMIAGSLVTGAQGIQISNACEQKLANLINGWAEKQQTQAAQIPADAAEWIQARG